jgi:hypothetical protein
VANPHMLGDHIPHQKMMGMPSSPAQSHTDPLSPSPHLPALEAP